jgi:aryl-alcohol dehydrogenase-like predicted oxidoreductase
MTATGSEDEFPAELIPGTSDSAHLAENIAAGSVRLVSASVTALDQLARPE